MSGNYTKTERMCQTRRKVLPGFPVITLFTSIIEIREYLSGETIICLLCGKDYKRIGTHLITIHGVTIDEYKEKYRIPWTYGLICQESSKKYSEAVYKRMANGWIPNMKIGKDHLAMISKEKRKCPFKGEIGIENLKDAVLPKYPLSVSPEGKLETFTDKRERLKARKGSDEFKVKMRNRPQCQPDYIRERGFHKIRLGKNHE